MTSSLRRLALVLLLAGLAGRAAAQIIYVQFSGSTASGSVNGEDFSDQSWKLEFGVTQSRTDSDSNSDVGEFSSAIVSGNLRIGAATYALSGSSITGSLHFVSVTGFDGYGQIYLLPGSGGRISFRAAQDQVVGTLFTNQNSITSAVVGSSLANTAPDGNNTASDASFLLSTNPLDAYDERLIAGGDKIALSVNAAAGSGEMTVAIASQSFTAVPEPSTYALLLGLGAVGGAVWWRRRPVRG